LVSCLAIGAQFAAAAPTPSPAKASGPVTPDKQIDAIFKPQEHGGMHVKITQPGAINESERVPAASGTADFLPYAGVYWSDELETQYTFFVRDGALYARHGHHGEVVLAPTTKDEFSTGWWFTPHVKFIRDGAGNISGVTLGGGRVAAVAFTRKSGPKH
jgi:hypothetical protein